jgi:NAD(P)-dependent dehydrogenase (short-subunit alcohol dehydrogenase family)
MKIFSLEGKNAVVLGGAGVLGKAMAEGLAKAGANIAITDRTGKKSAKLVEEFKKYNVDVRGYSLEVSNSKNIEIVCNNIYEDFGKIDILVNSIGGNMKEATTSDERAFFDLSEKALSEVVKLNLMDGTIIPCQIFGKKMLENSEGGSIINISSMASLKPLTKIPGYSASKAAVSNYTQWLATELSLNMNSKLRVNAIAPGFFLTEQNRFLLTEKETGDLTKRGQQIIGHTPMGRFGNPEDLVGAVVWLASDASKFVTGTVIPVDGGFSGYTGV